VVAQAVAAADQPQATVVSEIRQAHLHRKETMVAQELLVH
jgi:hypothetical protein